MSLTQDLRWSLGRSIALQLQRQTDLLLCTINCFLQWDHLPNMAVGDLASYYTLYLWFKWRIQVINILHAGYSRKSCNLKLTSSRDYRKNHCTNTRLVCTHLKAFCILNPNMAMKSWIFNFFFSKYKILTCHRGLHSTSERVKCVHLLKFPLCKVWRSSWYLLQWQMRL